MPLTHPYVPSRVLISLEVNQPDLSERVTGIRSADLWQCPGCHERYSTGDRCATCVPCHRCATTVPQYNTVPIVGGSTICNACLPLFYWQCIHCNAWNRDNDNCGNHCRDEDTNSVHDYSYKPRPMFHGVGPLFLGAEIEIQTPCDEARPVEIAITHLGSLGYLKEDSTIDGGFEIVTHPMSYNWAIANFPWQMLTDLAGAGCEATQKTGIHIHLSRAGFTSPCHTYRWMKFIYRNETQVTAVARRSSQRWAAFHENDRRCVKEYAKGNRYGDRYRAINISNRETFELRIFASSLDPQQVQATLAFAAASVEYTRGLTAHDITRNGAWQWPAFVTWLEDKAAYRPLRDQLEKLACAC
jgi:hypothetical protein